MALPPQELRRRVRAAGALLGLGQRQIRRALADFGADATLADRMISGAVPQSQRNIRDLAEALGMPQAWFTEEDWRPLVPSAPAAGSELAERAIARAARVLSDGENEDPELRSQADRAKAARDELARQESRGSRSSLPSPRKRESEGLGD